MRNYIRKNKTTLLVAALLVFGSGCVGAVSKTGDQLTEDAMKPITVPIREGTKAMDTLEGVNTLQEQRRQQMEDIQ